MSKMVKIATESNMDGKNPFQKYVNYLLTANYILEKDVPSDECLFLAKLIEPLIAENEVKQVKDLIISSFFTSGDGWENIYQEDYDENLLNETVNKIKEKYEELCL